MNEAKRGKARGEAIMLRIVRQIAQEWKSEIGDQFLDEGGKVLDQEFGGAKTREIPSGGLEEVLCKTGNES
jgi:hypothetical protein